MLLTNSNVSNRSSNRALLGNGYLSPAFTFSRASSAALVRSTDSALVVVGNNIPRFDPNHGLLIEALRTNAIPNSSAFPAGFTAIFGGTGTAPASVLNDPTFAAPDGTFTATRVTLNVGAGTSGSDFSGWERTVTSGANSIWVRTVSGTATVQIGDGLVTGHTSIGTSWVRYFRVSTLFRVLGFAPFTNGNFQILVWQPQAEAGASFPSSPIITTSGAVTRLTDNVSSPLSSLGISASGACTIVSTFMLPQVGPFGTHGFPNGVEINAGNIDNRAWVYFSNGNAWLSRVTATVNDQIQFGSGITPNTPYKVAFAGNGTGRFAASFNGGTTQNITGAPTSLSQFRIGSGFGGDQPLNGFSQSLSVVPYTVSDAVLQQFSAL
jgi:hypothetical protein